MALQSLYTQTDKTYDELVKEFEPAINGLQNKPEYVQQLSQILLNLKMCELIDKLNDTATRLVIQSEGDETIIKLT
jgi:hypothetical protein